MKNNVLVVIPVYNAAAFLRRCVDSVLAQTYANFRILLMDDGSTDSSPDICRDYVRLRGAEKVTFVSVAHIGAAGIRNRGIELALSDPDVGYVAFVDSDDVVHRRYLESLAAGIDLGACVSVVRARFVLPGDVRREEACEPSMRIVRPGRYWQTAPECNACWGKLFDKRLLENVRFPEGIPFEDEFFTYRIFFSQRKIAFGEVPLYDYVQRENSVVRVAGNTKAQILSQTTAHIGQLRCLLAHGEWRCAGRCALRIAKNLVKLLVGYWKSGKAS